MEQDLHSNGIFFTFIELQLPERDDEEKRRKRGKGEGDKHREGQGQKGQRKDCLSTVTVTFMEASES